MSQRETFLRKIGCIVVIAAAGCTATGDPSQGGLFGWSENSANGRQQALAQHLNHVEKETDSRRRRIEELEQKREDPLQNLLQQERMSRGASAVPDPRELKR